MTAIKLSTAFQTGTSEFWRERNHAVHTGENTGVLFLQKALSELFEEVIPLPSPDEASSAVEADYLRMASKLLHVEHHDLLEQAFDHHGLPWTIIAKVVGVSVPAIRKWRHGGDISDDNKTALAKLVALCDVVRELGVLDVAEWLVRRVRVDVDVRWVDVAKQDRFDLLLGYAEGQLSPEQVLSQSRPQWAREREKTGLQFMEGGPVLHVTDES